MTTLEVKLDLPDRLARDGRGKQAPVDAGDSG